MFGNPVYNSTIRTYTTVFGSLFDNIQIRKHEDGQLIRVPIDYSSKEKFIAKMFQTNADDIENQKPDIQTILPRIGYQLIDVVYDSSRKTNTTHKHRYLDDNDAPRHVMNPVPYSFMFELFVHVRHINDAMQIMEQILPYFQPQFNVTINEEAENGLSNRDVPIVMDSVSLDDAHEGDFNSRRTVEVLFSFNMNGYIYPPSQSTNNVIKHTIIDFNGVDRDVVDYVSIADGFTNDLLIIQSQDTPDSQVATTEIRDV
jgi:hypothetical protein